MVGYICALNYLKRPATAPVVIITQSTSHHWLQNRAQHNSNPSAIYQQHLLTPPQLNILLDFTSASRRIQVPDHRASKSHTPRRLVPGVASISGVKYFFLCDNPPKPLDYTGCVIVDFSIFSCLRHLFTYALTYKLLLDMSIMRGDQTLRLIQLYYNNYPEIARNTQDADGRKARATMWQQITDELNHSYNTGFSVEQYKKKIQNVQCTSRQKIQAGKR